MEPLDKKQIAEVFNKLQERDKRTSVANVLEDLSKALADLHEFGIDVTLDISPLCAERHFALFGHEGGTAIGAAGMLTIGNEDHLIAISPKVNDKECLKLAVSVVNMRHESIQAMHSGSFIQDKIRADIYDWSSTEALQKLQIYIISRHATQQLMAQHDTHHSFQSAPSFPFNKGIKGNTP